MNIWDTLNLVIDTNKTYTNGYNTIKYVEPYEVKITDREGNEVHLLLANWRECKENEC